MISILGTPRGEDLAYIGNQSALKYVRSIPKRSPQNFKTLFPKANPVGLDLLTRMLTFNPDKRYTVQECLTHPYFEGLHDPEEEVEAEEPFNWGFDDFKPTKEIL